MAGEKRPTIEELKTMIGKRAPEAAVEIHKSLFRLFCDCIGETNPKWRSVAHPGLLIEALFFGQGLPVEFPFDGVVDLGSEIEFHRPIEPGDVITTATEFADIQDKSGEKGRRAFMSFRSTHRNQRHEVVAVSTSRMMSFG